METYYLVYALDKECRISKILMKGTLAEIDRFTSKFNDSNDIREEFREKIEEYRNVKKDYIEATELKTGKKETGDIVIHSMQLNKNREIVNIRSRVLYKYTIRLFNDLVNNNKELMVKFSDYSFATRNIPFDKLSVFPFSEAQTKVIKYYYNRSKTDYDRALAQWLRQIKKSDKYFATIRHILKDYAVLCNQNKELPSLRSLIAKYRNEQKHSKTKLYRKDIKGTTHFEISSYDDIEDSYYEELNDLIHAKDYFDADMTYEELNEYFDDMSETIIKRN